MAAVARAESKLSGDNDWDYKAYDKGREPSPTRRGSNGGGESIAAAARRMSLSRVMSSSRMDSTGDERDQADTARQARRRSSLMRMGVTDTVRSMAQDVLMSVASEDELTGTPTEKLKQLLTKAKERGMPAEKLFEYFAPAGQETISVEQFENALRRINPGNARLRNSEIQEMVKAFSKDSEGSIDLSDFMEFCLSIPTLPWKAEKARRLSSGDVQDTLTEAARNIERRKSSARTIALGEQIYSGSKFYWRTKETVDVVMHENKEENIITISTHSHESGKHYPPIMVDQSKIPVTQQDVVKAVEDSLNKRTDLVERPEPQQPEYQQLEEKTRKELMAEYLLNRLKVHDNVNEAPEPSAQAKDEPVPLEQRAPFLQRLSTDGWDTLLVRKRAVELETPYRFLQRRRSSLVEFRRASAEVDKLAREVGALNAQAESKVSEAEANMRRYRAAAQDKHAPEAKGTAVFRF